MRRLRRSSVRLDEDVAGGALALEDLVLLDEVGLNAHDGRSVEHLDRVQGEDAVFDHPDTDHGLIGRVDDHLAEQGIDLGGGGEHPGAVCLLFAVDGWAHGEGAVVAEQAQRDGGAVTPTHEDEVAAEEGCCLILDVRGGLGGCGGLVRLCGCEEKGEKNGCDHWIKSPGRNCPVCFVSDIPFYLISLVLSMYVRKNPAVCRVLR